MPFSSFRKVNRLLAKPRPVAVSPSDHWDGKLFFNPGVGVTKNLKRFFQWQLKRNKKPWPKRVEVQQTLKVPRPSSGEEILFSFVNHSTFLIQWQGLGILTDPIWSERTSPFSKIGPKRAHDPGIPFENLPQIDLVLVSHNHYDHLDLPTLELLQKKWNPVFVVALGDATLLREHGIRNVVEMDWHQKQQIGSLNVVFTPAQHWSGRGTRDRFTSLWGSFLVSDGRRSFYFAGDSGYGPHFAEINKKYGPVDVAFLPIGAYEPRWFMKAAHMNPRDAVLAHKDLGASQSVGMHFGTFQLTDEGIDEPVSDLALALKEFEVKGESFFTLKPGQSSSI
jgi:L-ascorbate metabolism protein UlaG (beta-lactamase superfamily)